MPILPFGFLGGQATVPAIILMLVRNIIAVSDITNFW
jgi:hypothetical protein